MIGIWNPAPQNAGIPIVESRIQDCLAFPYMGRPQGDSMYNPWGGGGGGVTPYYGLFQKMPLSFFRYIICKG